VSQRRVWMVALAGGEANSALVAVTFYFARETGNTCSLNGKARPLKFDSIRNRAFVADAWRNAKISTLFFWKARLDRTCLSLIFAAFCRNSRFTS
jgi:hypothetical protein